MKIYIPFLLFVSLNCENIFPNNCDASCLSRNLHLLKKMISNRNYYQQSLLKISELFYLLE